MRRSIRWAVPGAVAAVIAVGALAPGASADLPAKTPQEVLLLAQQADLEGFSGTVLVRTDLGIPTALLGGMDGESSMGSGGGLDDGDRTVRIWRSGETLARLSAATSMDEQTVIRNGDQLWYYDSDAALVRTGEVPKPGPDNATPPWSGQEVPDPTQVAEWVLATLEPTTTITAGEPVVVAGREAYRLLLEPTQDGTLVGEVSMAVDAQTGMVLQVSVTPDGAGEPAVDVAFTAFDPTPPAAEVFALDAPPGVTVEPFETPDEYTAPDKPSDAAMPEVIGEGWTSVVVLPPHDTGGTGPDETSLPPELLQPVPGGAVLTTSLVSVMFADDGRVLVGAVTPQVLAAAAA